MKSDFCDYTDMINADEGVTVFVPGFVPTGDQFLHQLPRNAHTPVDRFIAAAHQVYNRRLYSSIHSIPLLATF